MVDIDLIFVGSKVHLLSRCRCATTRAMQRALFVIFSMTLCFS
jgi:hypothetical protein